MFWFLWLVPIASGYYMQRPKVCNCDGETISCRGQGLIEIPPNMMNCSVIDLDLSWNEFETFPSGLDSLKTLKHLNLSHNKISTLAYGQLDNLEDLETVDLTYNIFHDWKDIHSGFFQPTRKLQFLDLSHNPLRTLSKFSNHFYIPSLKILRLVNCSMRTIPANVFRRLTSLTELYLSDNPINNISDAFTLQNLKLLEISNTRLSVLDENLFNGLPIIETLIMSNNLYLRRFNCHLAYLKYLDLSNCMLEKVPHGHMENLLTLDLSGNYLKQLHKGSFTTSYSLLVLNLSTNAITAIDEQAFQGLNEVQSIDLSFNKLVTLEKGVFSNNSALIFLNLSHNYIKELDNINSKSLNVLIASYCEIYELNSKSLSLMPSLTSLTVSRNFLTRLPRRLLATNLRVFEASYCRINTLNNETFAEMPSLKELNVANNALTSIDPAYLPKYVIDVTIRDNPWRCSCQKLKRMFEWITVHNSNDLDALICYSPENVEGLTWEQACENEWYPNEITKDTMWYYSLGIVISMVLALFALVVLRRIKGLQEQHVRLEEERRRAEEREALARMNARQREMREEEDRNAPDPRELQRPPSYNEALLLSSTNASHRSLTGSLPSLGSRGSLRGSNFDITKKNKNRRKRRRRKEEEERRASRVTVETDSSDEYQSTENLSSLRRKATQPPPLESDF